jgi:hypothetical protein
MGSPVNTKSKSTQHPVLLVLVVGIVVALVRRRVRARASILVPRPGAAADAAAHAAALAPVLHASRRLVATDDTLEFTLFDVAVPHCPAQTARPRRVGGAAESASCEAPSWARWLPRGPARKPAGGTYGRSACCRPHRRGRGETSRLRRMRRRRRMRRAAAAAMTRANPRLPNQTAYRTPSRTRRPRRRSKRQQLREVGARIAPAKAAPRYGSIVDVAVGIPHGPFAVTPRWLF